LDENQRISATGEKRTNNKMGKFRKLVAEFFLLSSRERMTLGVGAIFWFISHTITQCHANLRERMTLGYIFIGC
jgi:hypothetical protein